VLRLIGLIMAGRYEWGILSPMKTGSLTLEGSKQSIGFSSFTFCVHVFG
jgi:hypothetical protein